MLKPTNTKYIGDIAKELNQLCREQMKEKLLKDILMDLNICKLEGWPVKEYLYELKDIINKVIERNLN